VSKSYVPGDSQLVLVPQILQLVVAKGISIRAAATTTIAIVTSHDPAPPALPASDLESQLVCIAFLDALAFW